MTSWNVNRTLLLLNGCVALFLFYLMFTKIPEQPHLRCKGEEPEAKKTTPDRTAVNSDVASLTTDIRYNLEILRITNRSSTALDLQRLLEHQMKDLNRLLGIDAWRREISRNLSEKIRTTIHGLQNPEDCSGAHKLYCDMRLKGGLGAGVHNLLWCAHNAYLTRRMLVVMARNWHYTPGGWHDVFAEVSSRCKSEVRREEKTTWPGPWDDEHRHSLVYLPSDVEDQLRLLGVNPLPWWYGQLLGYYFKPGRRIAAMVERTLKELRFESPIVGLHIRRTDKVGQEGAYHPVSEYMEQVRHYFDTLRMEGKEPTERRVFVATDDPGALIELETKYKGYRFLFNRRNAEVSESLDTRYQKEGAESAIVDVLVMSRVDYLVCTLSSGFSRLAYELMLHRKPDALDRVYSVDTEFFYGGVINPPRMALYDHASEGDLELSKGDVLVQPNQYSLQRDATGGKVFDGRSKGLNNRTGKIGLYPLYKTRPVYTVKNVTFA